MNYASLARPSVLTQPVYEPGKPIEYVARELGLDPAGIIKLASNENPFGPSPVALAAAQRALEQGELYPDGGCFELLGHGFLGAGDEVVMGAPAFVVYKLVTLLFGARAIEVPLRDWRHDLAAIAAAITPKTKLVYVCSPNNPTGTANSEPDLMSFVRSLPEHVVAVIDEAYAEFIGLPAHLLENLRPRFAAHRLRLCERGRVRIAESRPAAFQRERHCTGRGNRSARRP